MQSDALTQRVDMNKHKSIKWQRLGWSGVFVCTALLSLIPSMYIPITWLLIPFMCILFFYDGFYALWGMFLFFEDNMVVIPGLSLFAVYSMLVLLKFFVLDKCEKKIPVFIIPAVIVMLLYALFAMPSADTAAARLGYIESGRTPPADSIINMRLIIGYILDSAVIIVLALRFSGNENICRTVCRTIVCTAVFSGIYGYTAKNVFLYGGDTSDIVRYMASFNDPNYAGFFFNMAIFIVLCLEEFKKPIMKIPLLVVFYYFLVATGSMSGLIFNVVGLVLFTMFKYKYKALIGLTVLAVIVAAAGFAVMKIPKIRNLPAVANMEERIVRQFVNTEENEADMTSGRAKQWKNYWGYFKNQELERKLFGGNMIMSYSVDQSLKDKFGNVPHQAYISFLLDFGVIGAVIVILFYLGKMAYAFFVICQTNSDTTLVLFIIACMWLFYGFGFDYFGDWRFMIYYFV